MELTGALSSVASSLAVVPRGRRSTGRPDRVSCVGRGGGGFADEGHLRYYEAAPRKAVEAVARDLVKLRAMGLVAGDAAKEKVLSEATELLLQELNQMKDAEEELKKRQKEEKAAMKALKKQQKEAKKAAAAMNCEESSSESSESDCEEEQSMKMSCDTTTSMPKIEQGMVMSMSVLQIAASDIATVPAMECDKAAMQAMKKREKEQKKAAKKAMKMKKKEEKWMATLNGCKDEDSSSCSSESSDSECEGEVIRMSRCTTITAPRTQPADTLLPIIVPQIPESVAPDAQMSSGPAIAMQRTITSTIAVVEKPALNRIEVCMGGKCKKSGALALLQEFEKEVGTDGAVVGCKCLGKCGLGPNVRLRSEAPVEGSVQKKNPLCIGVGLEDVGTIVAGFYGDGDLGMN